MKRFLCYLLVSLSLAACSLWFHGCAAEEEAIEEKAPDTEVENQGAPDGSMEATEKPAGEGDAVEMEPSSGPKGMKEAIEGEGK